MLKRLRENEMSKTRNVTLSAQYIGTSLVRIAPFSQHHASYTRQLPLLVAAPTHEWNTLLGILMQAQATKTKIVGSERKTIISLVMGLYQPAKRLQMGRNNLDHLILSW